MDYRKFLRSKRITVKSVGVEVADSDIHSLLFPFQRDLTRWAVGKGRAAIFADTGLGKSFMQLEWARLVGDTVLIVAPLSVARQTVREGEKIDIIVEYVRQQNEVGQAGIYITNYEMIGKFNPATFDAIVLDESSILKSLTGKIRRKLTDMFATTPYKLCCTATPAPNDYIELGNHAEFLGICSRSEMLAQFFINANKEHTFYNNGKAYRKKGSNKAGQEWRLKHHAEQSFFRWLSSWAIMMTKPSDLGYDDDGFILPPLNIHTHFVEADYRPDDQLFFTHIKGVREQAKIRQRTALTRLAACVRIIARDWNLTGDESCHTKMWKNDASIIGNVTCNIETKYLPGKRQDENLLLQKKRSKREKPSANGISRTASQSSRSEDSTMPKIEDRSLLALQNIERITKIKSEQVESSGVTALKYENTNDFLKSRMEDAQSVEFNMTKLNEDCALTMIMKPGLLEDCFASNATMALAHLQTTLNDCVLQSNTSPASLNKWVIWCGLNVEQEIAAKAFGNLCVSISGDLSIDEKIRLEELWREGSVPIMVTKSKIFGHGVNWQCAHKMIFFGLNFSWESYYQCVRREWRYLQEYPVDIHIVLSDIEDAIYHNVMRKDAQARRLREEMIKQLEYFEKKELGMAIPLEEEYREDTVITENWTMMLGDSSKRLREITDCSIDLSVYSPPFADLFTYTASARDLGNSRNWDEFFDHYAFIISEVLRVTKPGRVTCVHTSDIPALAQKDGYIGIKDFPGRVIAVYEKEGWIFHGRIVISKNPQAQAIRTHSKGLLFVQLKKDSVWSRPALLDQVLVFRKPGDNEVPITPVQNGELDNETWIKWACGIWHDINETNVLRHGYGYGRAHDDEKHICPLQLETIERCIKLWSNPGETILSPFAGIGSELYQAIRFGRKAIGIELKQSYFRIAVRNIGEAERQASTVDLFAFSGIEVISGTLGTASATPTPPRC